MAFTVVIVSYFKLHRLEPCINSILPQLSEEDTLLVIDNSVNKEGPYNPIRDYLRSVQNANGHNVYLQFNSENRLFTEAVNYGLEISNNEHVFLVNNDTEVTAVNTFQQLIHLANIKPKAATITPVTVNSKGKVYCSGAYGRGVHKRDKIIKPRTTEWNNFAFVLLKKSVYKEVGALATGIHKLKDGRTVDCNHFHSDCEYCNRCTEKGYEHWVHPLQVRHFHLEG